MLWNRYGAVALGACAGLVGAAGAACSKDYAAEPAPVIEQEAGVDASVDASVADVAVEAAAPDAAPKLVELANGLTGLAGIVADDTSAYVSTASGVVRVPLAGGATTPLGMTAAAPTGPIALASGVLFWSTVDTKTIIRSDASGSTITTFPLPLGIVPSALAAVAGGTDRLSLLSKGVAGGPDSIHQYTFELVETAAFQASTPTGDLAVHEGSAYWTEPGPGKVSFIGPSAVGPVELAGAELGCDAIAADGAGVYWTRPGEGLVRAFTSTNGAIRDLSSTETAPSSIVADENGIYWLDANGTLRRKRVDQELPPATLASGFMSAWANTHVHALAVTTKYAVWITNDGRVLRADK